MAAFVQTMAEAFNLTSDELREAAAKGGEAQWLVELVFEKGSEYARLREDIRQHAMQNARDGQRVFDALGDLSGPVDWHCGRAYDLNAEMERFMKLGQELFSFIKRMREVA